eukprot:5022714-Amphidinium_carterae.1
MHPVTLGDNSAALLSQQGTPMTPSWRTIEAFKKAQIGRSPKSENTTNKFTKVGEKMFLGTAATSGAEKGLQQLSST